MKIVDDNGVELDANFEVEVTPDGLDIIWKSRGGADSGPTPSRNKDYASGLELLLSRFGRQSMHLHDVRIDSREALKLPLEQRRVSLENTKMPVDLGVANIPKLRLDIGRASSAFGRSDNKPRGNNTKKIRLSIRGAGKTKLNDTEIQTILAAVCSPPMA